MKSFINFVENNTANQITNAFKGLSNSLQYGKISKAAMLFLQGRDAEMAPFLSDIPQDKQKQIIDMFRQSFPQKYPQMSSSEIDKNPQFINWQNTKLSPFLDKLDQQPQTQQPQDQKFSITGFLTKAGIPFAKDKDGTIYTTGGQFGNTAISLVGGRVAVRNRKTGKIQYMPPVASIHDAETALLNLMS